MEIQGYVASEWLLHLVKLWVILLLILCFRGRTLFSNWKISHLNQ